VSTLWTRLCRRLGVEDPIWSVGMGMVAGPELVAAASNAGGFGVFGTHDVSAGTIQVQVGRAVRMEHLQSQPAAADVALDQAVLDRIHDIAPPGTTISSADNTFDNPALEPDARRRQGAS
jgi:NAD(P)H-dependent flavin oxidoreductase YrpB (nitropropane dioxygenase family)